MHRYQNIRIKAFSKSSGKKQYYSQIRYPDVPLSSTDLYIKTKMGDSIIKLPPELLPYLRETDILGLA